MKSPPALGAEGQCIAVGASAGTTYTIRAIRAIIKATVLPLIDGPGCSISDPGKPEHGL